MLFGFIFSTQSIPPPSLPGQGIHFAGCEPYSTPHASAVIDRATVLPLALPLLRDRGQRTTDHRSLPSAEFELGRRRRALLLPKSSARLEYLNCASAPSTSAAIAISTSLQSDFHQRCYCRRSRRQQKRPLYRRSAAVTACSADRGDSTQPSCGPAGTLSSSVTTTSQTTSIPRWPRPAAAEEDSTATACQQQVFQRSTDTVHSFCVRIAGVYTGSELAGRRCKQFALPQRKPFISSDLAQQGRDGYICADCRRQSTAIHHVWVSTFAVSCAAS